MNYIPMQPIAAQTFSISLGGQSCQITLYQKSTGLFMDLSANNVVIFTGIVCRDRDFMVRYEYLGFGGDLAFMDTQGSDNPTFAGLGSRYLLGYFSPVDLA